MAKKKSIWPYVIHFIIAFELLWIGVFDFIVLREFYFSLIISLFLLKDVIDLLRLEVGKDPLLIDWFEHFPYALFLSLQGFAVSPFTWWSLIAGLDAVYDLLQDLVPQYMRD